MSSASRKNLFNQSATGTGGGGGGAVNAGTNISIPVPTVPVVSVAISSTLDMVQNTLDNCPLIQSSADITLSPVGVAKILNTTPTLRFDDTTTSVDVIYNATGSQFGESSLTTSAHEIGVYTGVVGENLAMGVDTALQTSYLTGQGLPLFIGESGQSSYSGLLLGNGNNPTDFIILDRKDNTDVSQTACSVALTGAGIINIDSQLATGGIGITTTASADISINSGKDIVFSAPSGISLFNTDVVIKGTNPSVDFKNSSDVEKASLGYVELTDKITLSGTNVVLESLGAGAPRVLLDSTGGNATIRADDIDVRLQRFNGTGTTLNTELALTGSGTVDIKAAVSAANPTLKLTNTDTSISASLDYDSFSVNLRAPDVPIYLTKLDGLGNAESSVVIQSDIIMLPSTGIVDLKGDTSISTPATLTFTDTSATVPTVNMSVSNDGFGFGNSQLSATAGIFSASSGAVEGIAIGTNGTENVVIGYGLPLKIANAFDSLPRLIADSSLIKFGIGAGGGVANVEITTDGDTLVTGDNSVIIRSNLTASIEGAFGDMLPSKVELVSGTATTTANHIKLVCGGFASGIVSMGDVFDAQNGSKIIINDASSFISITTATLTLPTIPLATKPDILYYDSVTKAVSYGANVLPVFVVGATSATPITLTSADNNKTYVFTTRPSAFQQFNAVGLPLGFSISVRNACGVGGGDISIRKDGAVVLGTLHPQTGSVNASTVPLEVNGTGLIGYF
jgi:hypothetical protein